MKNIQLLPRNVVKKAFNKTSVTYNPSDIWQIFSDISNGKPMTQQMTDDLFDFFLSIGIVMIYQKYPNDAVKYKDGEGFIVNDHQVDEMMDVISKMHDYYIDDPQRVLGPKYFPTVPNTQKDERRFHSHFTTKAGNLWIDDYRKRQNEPLARRLNEANKSFGDGEQGEKNRTDFHTEVMSETPDFLFMKSATGYEIDLFKACSSDDIYRDLSEKAKVTINSIYFSNHYKKIIKEPTTDESIIRLKPLIAFLSETKIILETIFTYLNPMSQKETQDFNYIVQGTISATTQSIMNCFKIEDGKLNITLTNDENSLDLDKMSEAAAEFLKQMIEKDFDIKRGEVSALAKSVVMKYQEGSNQPFTVSIPEGSEYNSFRTMVEMNGPMKVSIPFSTQGEEPQWSDDKILDDKMVQMIDESIKNAINQIDIGKSILKHL